VTSTSYSGDLGGSVGADEKCQGRAEAAGFSGTWTALLSTSSMDARDRIPDTEYRRMDGTVIASDKSTLFDGTIENPISITELNTHIFADGVWTGSSEDGTAANNCEDWTTSSTDYTGMTGHTHPDNSWISYSDLPLCINENRLYCVMTSQFPYAILSVDDQNPCAGDTVTFTVEGYDDNDVRDLWFYDGIWNSQSCEGIQTSCTKQWEKTEGVGVHNYSAYIYDDEGNGAWSIPQSISVEFEDCGIAPPEQPENIELLDFNGNGILDDEDEIFYSLLISKNYEGTEEVLDITGNSQLTNDDLTEFQKHIGESIDSESLTYGCPDLDQDGDIDTSDLDIVGNSFGCGSEPPTIGLAATTNGACDPRADVKADGEVNVDDIRCTGQSFDKEDIPECQSTKNKKNSERFTEKTAFIAPLRDWSIILSMAPLTTWTTIPDSEDWGWCKRLMDESTLDKGTASPREFNGNKRACSYPTLIYHEENGSTTNLNLEWDPIWTSDNKVTIGFYIDKGLTVGDVSLYMYQSEPHSGDLVVDIFDSAQERVIASAKKQSDGSSAIQPQWLTFNFVAPVELKKGYYQIQVYMNYTVTDPWMYWGFRYINNPDTELHRRLFKIGSEKVWNFSSITATNIDVDSTVHFLQQYAPDKVKIYAEEFELNCKNGVDEDYDGLIDGEDSDCVLLNLLTADNDHTQREIQLNPNNFVGAGLKSEQINKTCPNSYFSYWESIQSVVVVDYNNYTGGLMGAVFAPYLNAPLLFVSNDNLHKYENILKNRLVYVIGGVGSEVTDYINGNAKEVKNYALEDLQKDYVDLTGTNKLILVNSNDREIYDEEEYITRKTGTVRKLFGNQSIAAPFLAAAKQEVIIFADVPGSPENPNLEINPEIAQNIETINDICKDETKRLFNDNPFTMTIFAFPRAIPDYVGYYAVDKLYIGFDALPNRYNPSIAIDNNGNVHMVWYDYRGGDQEIYYKKLDNNGNIIVDDTRLTNYSGPSLNPSIAIDNDNNVHVVWLDYRDGGRRGIYYTKLNNDGNIIVNDIRLTAHPSMSYDPSIAIDSHNNIHIIWSEYEDGDVEIYYEKLDNNGNTLVDDKRLTEDPERSENPSIAIDSKDNVHIVWQDYRDGNYEVYYKRLDNNGNTIVPDKILLDNDAKSSEYPSIAIDSKDNIHIVWQDYRDGNADVYYKNFSEDIEDIERVEDVRLTNDSESSESPSIVIDNNNNVHVVWLTHRGEIYEIHYKKFDDEWGKDMRLHPKVPLTSFGLGRVYGITISDPFSTIARATFYSELFHARYFNEAKGNYGYAGLSIAHSFPENENYAKEIKDKTSNAKYDSVCFTGNPRDGCETGTKPDPDEYYPGRQFITFGDHGYPDEWIKTLKFREIPYLDLSVSIANACLTNNYWANYTKYGEKSVGGGKVFGGNFMRRGGIGYIGSLPISLKSTVEVDAIKKLTTETIPTGRLYTSLCESTEHVMDDYILLGDPTLVPKFKEVDWT